MKIVLMICVFLVFIGWLVFMATYSDNSLTMPDSKALLRDELWRLSER